jgi:hypothetical protein
LKPLQDIQTVVPTQLLSVNCLSFKDEQTKAFTVKVSKTDNVSVLKDLIKAKKSPHLDHLAASDLILYKVSISDAEAKSRLKEANADSKANSTATRILSQPFEKVKDVFLESLQESHVHIIFEYHDHPGMCSRH